MRYFIIIFHLLFLSCIVPELLLGQNVVKIGKYQIAQNTDVVIQLEVENSTPFAAFQADIPIPTGFIYAVGSAQLSATRISGHVLNASIVTGNVLRLIAYSVGNASFLGVSGSLISFKLKSGTVPGIYKLEVLQPLLVDAQSINVSASVVNGDITVLAPNLKLSVPEIDFGRVALASTKEISVQISNTGNQDLIIGSLVFNDSQFSTTSSNSLTIAPNNSLSIPVKFAPTLKGTYTKSLQINSNDPDLPVTAISLKAIAYVVNEIHLQNISGASSSTAKLEIRLNNMEEFTGFQFDISLPLPMTYVPGSAQLFRQQGHTVTVNQLNNQTLRVLSFSADNKSFTGNINKVLTLDFQLKGTAGNYPVGISNVIIANNLGENIVSASFGSQLQITAPDIDAATQLNFGDVSILSKSSILHRIRNFGQIPLTITQLQFSNDYFRSNQSFPLIIQPSGYNDLPVEFSKVTKGATTGTLKIVSDDPDENPFTIQLTGNAFSPNYLLINSQSLKPGESKSIAIEIENEEPLVAFQFDLTYPDGFTPDLKTVTLSDRKQDHILSATAISKTTLRILVYSSSQKTFSGKSGAVVTIPFKAESSLAPGIYNLAFTNALISNIESENILYSAKNGILTILKSKNPPIANAGIDQSVVEKSLVTLDGSASSDPDGDQITYKWTAPAGITLSSSTSSKPTFTAPEVQTNTNLIFNLVVNDGNEDSPADQVIITLIIDHIPTVKDTIKNVSVDKGAPDQIVDLSKVFAADSGDVLSYTISSNSNDQVVTATISNSILTLKFSSLNSGLADIEITASTNGKTVRLKFKVEVKLSTGIDDIPLDSGIVIFPNPTNGIVQIKFNEIPERGAWLSLCDISGKVISKIVIDNEEISINMIGNPRGIYFIKIYQKTVRSFKLILE